MIPHRVHTSARAECRHWHVIGPGVGAEDRGASKSQSLRREDLAAAGRRLIPLAAFLFAEHFEQLA
jgi:hypothetical protein